MAQKIKVSVTVDGEPVPVFSSVRLSQRMDWHHSFEIDIPLEDKTKPGKSTLHDNASKFIGKPIAIGLGAGTADKIFEGLITSVSYERHSGNIIEISLKGESPTILLEDGIYCRSFTKKTIDKIFDAVKKVPNNLLKAQIKPKYKDELDYFVQYKETNYRFLSRLMAFYGEWFYYDGLKLIVGEPDNGKSIDLKFAQDLSSFQLAAKVAPTKFKVKTYNYEDGKYEESSSSQANISDLDDVGKFLLSASDKLYTTEASYYTSEDVSGKELIDMVKRRKAAVTRDFFVASGSTDNPKLKLGGIIHIDTYGEFRIISINHTSSFTGEYQNSFEAIPAKAQFPPQNSHLENPYCETQPAVVKEINDENDDFKGLGRVKVKFHWQDSPETSPWIRVVNQHSGADKGFYFLPEVGDEVLVAFEHDSPLEPYVIGSMYHAKAKPKWYDKDNKFKAIRTRSGNEIYFSDEKNKEIVRIVNRDAANEVTLSLEGDGKITIKTKGKLELSAKSISIEAQEGITMRSGKATEMEAQNMKVKASQEYSLQGQEVKMKATNTKINSDSNLEIEAGANAKIKAGASLNVEGGAAVKLKAGATMDIDGGTAANVKAGMIKLN